MDYSALQATASRLIAAKGQPMTLHRRASQAYDPATGSVSVSESQHTINGVVVPISRADDNAFDPQTVVQGRARIIIADATDIEPQDGDTVTFDGFTWNVIGSTPVNPAGTAIINRIRVTR